ncbi:SusC/RagA family TonB-linked outer membrane protein [Pontibacter arcticus]|uniref:SusC/RagA family TonB-linked outer membrane protein n=1 Tax=Pontibacter arcticus TaxID=2080288 RepID=A0A364RI41_9BACT|nr:TonB-dependent receptor [Pontibacter arcticus]RAU83934.1 SusC/RagA family TonB-linked outer membrane protein [Pontibacter arcticus]
MRKSLLLTFLFLLAFVVQTYAQQNRTVSGKVTDQENGQGLPGVAVLVKGTTIGTATNTDGSYTLSVPADANTLVFRFIGYVAKEVAIGSQTSINTTLALDNKQLSEVIVTGYGTVQTKRDAVGAISQVAAKNIENKPMPSLDKALQGQAAGVLVQANNGIPGGAINVRIRGVGSIQAGTQPLYVVDGVQLNVRSDASFTQSNPLAFLNPNDILSIEVLKDAATAAIYGAQAANGVVLITTKKGKAGKTVFTANAYGGVSAPLKKLDVLNTQDYIQMRTEATNNANRNGLDANRQAVIGTEMRIPDGATLTPEQIAALPTYDWQDAVMQTGKIQNYELSASGGNDKTTFYIAGSYNLNEAMFKKVDFRRGTAKMDLTHKATDKLTLASSVNLSSFSQKAPFATDGSSLGNPAFSSSLIIPSNRIYNEDGSYFGMLGSGQTFPGILNQNIVAVNDYNDASQRNNFVVGNISATYQIIPSLSFKSFYGLDYRIVQGRSYRDPRTSDAYARKGLGQVESTWNTNFITSQTLNYNQTFNDQHTVTALAGFEYKTEQQEGIFTSADGFPSPEFRYLNSAANPLSASEFFTNFKRISGFGRVNYSFGGKYLVAVTARYDGSSRFGTNNQFGLFPSVQLGWNVSEEEFLKSVDFLSFLKLRASYGTTGNDQISNFASRGLYGSGALYNGSAGINPSQLPNPDLKWERNETVNLGLDFGFFNDRIAGTIEVYNRMSRDLLLDQPVSWTAGYGAFTSNVGELRNRGIELEIRTANIQSAGGFTWNTNFNIARNENEVMELYGGLDVLPSDNTIRVGYPVGTIFTQKYAGVNPATGRPMFYDINDNITYTPVLADRRIIGDTQPEWYGGLTNTFAFKGFELDFMFQYEYGRIQSDGQLNFLSENGNRQFNTLQYFFDNRWTTPGQITSVPRPYNNGIEPGGVNHVSASSRIYNKVDYIRLKSITFAYNVPTPFLQFARLSSAKVYAQGSNLFTYDDFKGYDPEFFGSATGIIPQGKNYTVGIQLGF